MKDNLLKKATDWLAADGWKLAKSGSQARAWRLDVPDGPPVLRFEIDIDAPARTCADYTIHRLLDTHGEWNSSFIDGKVIDDGNERLYHLRYKGVWPVKGRDFVYRSWIESNDSGATTEVSMSVEDSRFPHVDGSVRGAILLAYRQVEVLADNQCRYVSVAQSDIKGNVPEWMVTPGIVKNMYDELSEIAHHVCANA